MNKRYIDFVPPKKSAAAAAKKVKTEKTTEPVKVTRPASKPAVKPTIKPDIRPVSKPVEPKVVEEEPVFVEEPADVEDPEMDELSLDEIFVEKEEPKFGVIEDFKPHFVKTEVPKRPLNKKPKGGISVVDKGEEAAPVAVAKEAKPEKVGRFGRHKKAKNLDIKPVAKDVAKEAPKEEPKVAATESVEDKGSQNAALEAVRNKKVIARGTVAMRKKPQVSGATSTVSSGEINKILDEAFMEAENITRRDRRTMRTTPFVNTEGVEKRPLSGSVATKKRIFVPKEEPSGPVTIIQKPEKDSRVGLIVAIIITIILGATAGTVAFLLLPK
jgi:hypothetical protein